LEETVTNPEDYSPMPSEEPSESPFEARRPSLTRSEKHSQPENPAKTDSDQEPPKKTGKKGKRKKGKKGDGGAGRHDEESQIVPGE
jgi:hypothetical protein